MALRQYIGARYVPKFSDVNGGVWDDTYTYEPLTIVKHGNDYYTSKKEVPTGISITNTEYWALTGNYNGAISELQGEINVINGSILTMGGQIDSNTDHISNLESEVDNLGRIIDPSNRRVVFISDSYGTHSTTNWAARVAQYWGLSSDDAFIFAEGSIGFAATNGAGTNFLTLLQRNLSSISDRDTITDIIVGGGTNDFFYWTNISDLDTAIANFINYCKSNFPNAKITCVFMGYDARMTDSMRENYKATIRMYGTQFIKRGCSFINAYQVMHYYYCREDFEHPNETGNEMLACAVIAEMEGHSLDFYHNSTLSTNRQTVAPLTLDSAFTPGTVSQIEEHIDGDNVLISIQLYGATLSNPSWTVGSTHLIGSWDSDIIPLPDRSVLQMPAFVKINNQIYPTNLTFAKSSSDSTGKTNQVSMRWCPATISQVSTFDIIFAPVTYPLIEW